MAPSFRSKSPKRYLFKYGSLRYVFPDDNMHAEIARLLVLYEDLKIESFGMGKKKITSLSTTNDGQYPQRYFLRRAIATLSECANCMIQLDRNPQFKRVKQNDFSDDARAAWEKAIAVCKKPGSWLIRGIRNDEGGHFGVRPARRALKSFREGTRGKIEYSQARAFVTDRDMDAETAFRKLLEVMIRAHGVVLIAVPFLIY